MFPLKLNKQTINNLWDHFTQSNELEVQK